jgi:hypothetical protein
LGTRTTAAAQHGRTQQVKLFLWLHAIVAVSLVIAFAANSLVAWLAGLVLLYPFDHPQAAYEQTQRRLSAWYRRRRAGYFELDRRSGRILPTPNETQHFSALCAISARSGLLRATA